MPKVAIVGTGFVGSSAAYAMLIRGSSSEIALIDVHKEKAEGEAMDLEHGMQFVPETKISYGDDYALCQGAEVIVITAGLAQKPGETRLDFCNRNAAIFKDMVPKIMQHAKNPIILVISNPVDIMTYITLKYSGMPKTRVFGSGTSLDSARLRYHIGTHFNVSPHNVHAFMLGEHGDSEFPVWSRANIAGLHLHELEGYGQQALDDAAKKTRTAAYEIISRKGATYYAIGLVIAKLVEAMLRDQHDVTPLSVYLDNYYDEGGICMSVPCVLGKDGIIKTLQLPLSEEEQRQLHASAAVLRNIVANMKL